MKKFTPYILIVIIAILVLGTFGTVIHAQTPTNPSGGITPPKPVNIPNAVTGAVGAVAGSLTGFTGGIMSIVTGVIAGAAWVAITVVAWLLSAAGTILNVSMYLTTHLGLFIDQSPSIYAVWTIIRDISSTLLIFFILYAAIQMILGLQDAKYGELIKSIIIVGVLINFSFFFTRVLIDLSNIVSLEFYNAMAPTNTVSDSSGNITDISLTVTKLMTSGGVSDIMMGALQIDNFWKSEAAKPSALLGGNDYKANVNIIILEVAGIAVVVITIINFLVISMICVARIAILIFLLGFSPIWIAAMGMPKLKDLSSEWTKQFKAQLLFLPAYLAFLYVALRIITASKLSSVIANQNVGTDSATLWGNMINLLVGFSIIIIMLNIPIIAAAKVAGVSGGFISKAYGGMTKKVKGWTKSGLRAGASGTWNNTGGRVASRIAQNDSFQQWAGRSRVGQLALQSTRGVATNFNKNLDAKVKSREDFAKTLNRDGATAYANRLSGSVSARVGTSIMHTVGRADRVGAAKIFNTRETEIKADLNRLTGELNQINNAAATATGGLASLPIWQQQRHAELTGTTSTLNPTGKNEISVAQTDLTNIRIQISNFQKNTGETTSKTARRNY